MKSIARASQIGPRLRERRLAASLTLQEAAHEIGMSIQSLSKWEIGKHRPSVRHLELLAKVYKCTVHDFLATSTLPLSPDGVAIAQMVDGMKFGGTKHVAKEFVGRLAEWERQIAEHED